MARRPRSSLAGIPQHVRQLSNNRQVCFFCNEDFEVYLLALETARRKHACNIHAYVLMAGHVQLLATPLVESGISLMMQSVGRRYVRYFNRRYKFAGTLWERHYRSDSIGVDGELLICYRHIELNPIRAGIADRPASYPWSSHSHNALGRPSSIVVPHASYLALGDINAQRQSVYRSLFQEGPALGNL